MLVLTFVGAAGFYNLVGTYSGQDSICLSGIFSGVITGLWVGKYKGLQAIYSVLVCAFAFSFPLVLFSLLIARPGQDIVESLAFFSIGFSLLAFYIFGLSAGKHLTSRSS
jgi:hypothetical protein